jgi:tetratricopeptide (TPR) repeat protein
MKQIFAFVLLSLLITACAPVTVKPVAMHPHGVDEEPEESDLVLPNVELTDELLYQFLVTEVASQRGEVDVAVNGSLDLAKSTRDPRLAMRASQLALQAGQMDKAIEALALWRETDPKSPIAMRMYASTLLRAGKLEKARAELQAVLDAEKANAGHIFFQIYQMLAPYPDKDTAIKLVRDLAQPYPGVAESHWAVAQLAQASGNEALALSEAREARKLRPEWDATVSLEAYLLRKSDPLRGLGLLRDYLSDYPDANEIRLQYARALLDQKHYREARAEFQHLADLNPDNPETAYAIALISLQMKDYSGAEEYLKQSLNKGKKDQNTVHYYLGQLDEAKQEPDEAIENYRKVDSGEYQFIAQMRVAILLSKAGKLDQAVQQLHQMQAEDNKQKVQLISVEAQFYREAGRLDDAYRVMQQGLASLPDDPDLLYGTGMLADMLGKHDVFEQMMRKLIVLQPNHAHAYNALGYGLLERNERIPEAMDLVQKALQLAPEDPAIMDSVGWGYYRNGELDQSVKMLRRAFAGNPDPEIAAHLGEVLWVSGDKASAKKVWMDSLDANPDSKQLQAVIKKFMP